MKLWHYWLFSCSHVHFPRWQHSSHDHHPSLPTHIVTLVSSPRLASHSLSQCHHQQEYEVLWLSLVFWLHDCKSWFYFRLEVVVTKSAGVIRYETQCGAGRLSQTIVMQCVSVLSYDSDQDHEDNDWVSASIIKHSWFIVCHLLVVGCWCYRIWLSKK